jgi:hypothetical protein
MTTAVRSLMDPAVAEEAARDIDTSPRFWVGHSGELALGEDVAAHLEAALALLEKRGWSRTWDDPDPELPAADESMSVKAILLALATFVRDLTVDRGPLTLSVAVSRVQGTVGDADTSTVADRVMDALLRAHTGAAFAAHSAWASKRARTWDDVRDLMTAAARFARAHGPR